MVWASQFLLLIEYTLWREPQMGDQLVSLTWFPFPRASRGVSISLGLG